MENLSENFKNKISRSPKNLRSKVQFTSPDFKKGKSNFNSSVSHLEVEKDLVADKEVSEVSMITVNLVDYTKKDFSLNNDSISRINSKAKLNNLNQNPKIDRKYKFQRYASIKSVASSYNIEVDIMNNSNQKKTELKFIELVTEVAKNDENITFEKYRKFKMALNNVLVLRSSSNDPEIATLLKSLRNISSFNQRNHHISDALYKRSIATILKLKNCVNISHIWSDIRTKASEKKKQESRIVGQSKNLMMFLPKSPFRRTWEYAILYISVINIVLSPLFWVTGYTAVISIWYLILEALFFFDISLRFNFAYYDSNNNIAVDDKAIIMHYLKNEFIFDFLPIFPFYLFINEPYQDTSKLLKVFGITKFHRLYSWIEESKYVQHIRILLLCLVMLLFAHFVGILSFLFISHSEKFRMMQPQEINECLRMSSFNYEFRLNCVYSFSVFDGLSLVMKEDIELYDLTYMNFLFFLIVFIHVCVTFVNGTISLYLTNLASSYWKRELKDKMLMEYFEKTSLDHNFRNEIRALIKFNRDRHTIDNRLVSLMTSTIKDRVLAIKNISVIRKLTFFSEHKVDDVILGSFLGKLVRHNYSVFDVIYDTGETTKGLYVLDEGKLDFGTYQLPLIKGKDQNWMLLGPDEIRSLELNRKN